MGRGGSALSAIEVSRKPEEQIMPSRVARVFLAGLLAASLACPVCVRAQASDEWITMNKDYSSQRYVDLDQITPANVGSLKEVCEVRINEPATAVFTSGLLMVGRTIYVNTLRATYAIDAANCDLRWRYQIALKAWRGVASRGSGYWDGKIFFGTIDGQLIALDADTGKPLWDVENAIGRGENFISAPIAWGGKVFIGIGVSDNGIRGRFMAFDANTGKELWRWYSIPLGNEPGADTWRNDPSVPPAGGGFWASSSLDPMTGEVFAPVANPYPDYLATVRPGANLYTNSIVSLNISNGKMNWYHQGVPHDQHDWDLGTSPSLYRSRSGKNMLAIAGKDGTVLGIDRDSKELVFRTPGTTRANVGPFGAGPILVCPGTLGGAQWNGTSYDTDTGTLYTGMVDWCWYYGEKLPDPQDPRHLVPASVWNFAAPPRGQITAIDGENGDILWQYRAAGPVLAGLVPTKSGLLFAGDVRGNLLALDARTGAVLDRLDARGALNNGLISYAVDGTQYVAAVVGGVALNTAGVAGPLRVSIFGLHGSDTPKIVRLVPLPRLGSTRAEQAALEYGGVCADCHGMHATGGAYPTLERQTQLAGNAEALKAFLAYVPPPMPRLYPGLLSDADVELIAEHLKVLLTPPSARSAPPAAQPTETPRP
jgi:alcohol dehydrogenase (cytochrome c)